jgi:preprotein translocase subunit SecG
MMDLMYSITLGVHVVGGLAVIGLVLLQHGKGADMGAAFGSGASGSLFGSSGSANFLSRSTAVLAAIFFLTSLGLSYIANLKPQTSGSVLEAVKSQQQAVPGAAGQDIPGALPVAPADSKAKDIPK